MTRALLLGGDLSAFAAALDLAEVGVEVWVASAQPQIPSLPVRDPGGEIGSFLRDLASPATPDAPRLTEAEPREVATPDTLLRARDGSWKPQPQPSVWGIPTVPLSTACIAMLGMGGAVRAYVDRVKPVLTIGQEANFAKLVDSRIGENARNLLVEPLVRERFGVSAVDADVALVEPGLNGALTRAGSLSGGAMLHLEEHVARETMVEPSAGWEAFGPLLAERLALYGAKQFPGKVAAGVLVQAAGESGSEPEYRWEVTAESGEVHGFDALIGDPEPLLALVDAGLDARVRVDSAEAIAENHALRERLVALRAGAVRDYAEIGIHSPQASSEALAGPAGGGDTDRLALVDDSGGQVWAARVTRGGTGDWVLRLAGPARPSEGAAESFGAPVSSALEVLGVSRAGEESAGREHMTVQRPAAFATAAARDAQANARAEVRESFPSLVIAGAAAHGDALGEALGEARDAAVRLRRKLTGISE